MMASLFISDDAKCFKLLNMEINPQFVDRCAAQIHLMYKKRKMAIEQQKFFATIFKSHSSGSFLLLLVALFLICQFFIRPHYGSAAFVIFL